MHAYDLIETPPQKNPTQFLTSTNHLKARIVIAENGTMDKTVATFSSALLEDIHVDIKKHKGKDFVDIRVYSAPQKDSEKVATGRGIVIPTGQFNQFKKIILETEALLKENGLISDEQSH